MFRRFVLPYFQAPSGSKIAVKDGLFLEEEGATNVLLMSGTSQPNTQHCFAEDFNLLYIQGVPGGNVPYVKVHRYNPKHLYPKLNGYGDNGERILKV